MSVSAKKATGPQNEAVSAVTKRAALDWPQQLRLKFKAGIAHTFIINGNVRDLADNRLPLDLFLTRMFLQPVAGQQNFDIVVFYDRSTGLRFPNAQMEEKFKEAAGLDKKPQATAGVFAAGASASVLPRDPQGAFTLVERVLTSDRKNKDDNRAMHTVFIIDYAESLFPAGNMSSLSPEDRFCIVKLLNWAKDPKISNSNNPIILIADSMVRLNDTLTASASRIESVEVLLPTPTERESFIDHLEKCVQEDNKAHGKTGGLDFEAGFDKLKFAHLTAGLKKLNIEDIKMTAEHINVPISAELVKARKKEIYKQEYASVLEVIDPEQGFEVVGGMDWLKVYHQRAIINQMLNGNTKACPMGILYTGAPGTGKSIFASALAFEAKMNMVKLDVGKLLGSLVGESEHNMQKALLAIRSLVPVIVWMDEIDQAINRGSHGDSGVSDRIFKMLLEFMSDTDLRGRVLFVAATNRPDSMDSALKRRGRFDKIIPFIPPDTAERADIFPAVMRRYGYEAAGKIDFEQLAKITSDWVGSDIEAAMVKAYEIASREDREKISQGDIELAIDLIIPATQDVKLWTQFALAETSDKELLPPRFRKEFDKVKVEQEIRKLKKTSLTYETEEHRKGRDVI